MEGLQEWRRRSCAQTSTGIGHVYLKPLPSHTELCEKDPLPPILQQRTRVSSTPHYTLTSHTQHDHKDLHGPLANAVYTKASSHWHTHYLNELGQSLKDSRSIRLVSEPISEMQDNFRGRSAPQESLDDHHTTMLALYGQLHSAPALLTEEPQMSTTHTDYKFTSRSPLAPPSFLDALPTKATLTKSGAFSRLPPHKTPPNVASQLLLPHPSLPLPHGGRSLYMDSFRVPAPSHTFSTPCAGPNWVQHREEGGRDLLRHILEVPKMYHSENQTYGKKRMVLL